MSKNTVVYVQKRNNQWVVWEQSASMEPDPVRFSMNPAVFDEKDALAAYTQAFALAGQREPTYGVDKLADYPPAEPKQCPTCGHEREEKE